jgi:xylose isomerase
LSGHSFQHEVTYALNNDIFGSVDINRGDYLLGWDTDQFPIDVTESALVMYTILKGGGFKTGGMNFDAKLRRQSIDAQDLFHGHIGGMDTLARGLLAAERMLADKKLESLVAQRYAGWQQELGQKIMSKKMTLDDLSSHVLSKGLEPKPRSGRQEAIENLVNRYV